MIVKVPPGTVVTDAETEQVLADLTEHGQRAVIAKGGRGGRGNSRFATPANPAPQLSENGEPGKERDVILELKVLADVGLVGFPSVGKSTLLSIVSSAKPKLRIIILQRLCQTSEWLKQTITEALSWRICQD